MKDINEYFEYGVIERIIDIFVTLGRESRYPESLYKLYNLVGIESHICRKELLVKITTIVSEEMSPEEFISKIRGLEKQGFITINKVKVSNLKLSNWAN